MSGQLNTFNGIARYYDTLKGVVFGKSIYKSQLHFLEALPCDGDVLIIGGGSGEILPPLRKLNPASRIWYIDASSEMLSMAARHVPSEDSSRVTFIHGSETSLPAGIWFDGVITNFFLDVFSDEQLVSVIRMVSSRMRRKGVWLVSDFVDGGKWWHGVLLKIMYRFFNTTCGVAARNLPLWDIHLRTSGLVEMQSRHFFGKFIRSSVYIKDA